MCLDDFTDSQSRKIKINIYKLVTKYSENMCMNDSRVDFCE